MAEAYFGVLLARGDAARREAEKAAIGMQRDRAQARFDVGRGKITDLQEAQARYDEVTTKEISARSTLELRRAEFRETIGLPAEGAGRTRRRLRAERAGPSSLAAWQTRGEDAQHARAGQALGAGDRQRRDREVQARGPSDGEPGGRLRRPGQSGGLSPLVASDHQRTGSVGLQFNVPLYAGGAIDSRERESIARQGQAEQELAAAQRDVRLRVQDAYLAVTTGVSRVASFTQSLVSARTALEATTLGRDVGTRTELDVLDAQQRVFAAELDFAQARFDYLLGRVRLAAAAGELDEADLRNLNGLLASR